MPNLLRACGIVIDPLTDRGPQRVARIISCDDSSGVGDSGFCNVRKSIVDCTLLKLVNSCNLRWSTFHCTSVSRVDCWLFFITTMGLLMMIVLWQWCKCLLFIVGQLVPSLNRNTQIRYTQDDFHTVLLFWENHFFSKFLLVIMTMMNNWWMKGLDEHGQSTNRWWSWPLLLSLLRSW